MNKREFLGKGWGQKIFRNGHKKRIRVEYYNGYTKIDPTVNIKDGEKLVITTKLKIER